MKALVVAGLVAAAVLAGCGGTSGGGATGGGDAAAKPHDATQADVQVSTAGWKTDFAKHSVPLDQFASGGPGKDGIPAIDHPRFAPVDAADRFISGQGPVAVLELDRVAKAYPIQIIELGLGGPRAGYQFGYQI